MVFTISPAVRGRRLAVPVLLALSGLGWAAVHGVAHRAVMSEPEMPAAALADYLRYLTTSVALCLALALPLAAGAMAGRRWKGSSLRSLWLFGLVPVLGFVGHTVVEPLFGGTALGSSVTSLVPVALVGLLIQIPFALVAVGLARRVLWLAESLARAIARPAQHRSPAAAPGYPRPRAILAPAFRLDRAHPERGPPLLLA
jgi:hypothetical protein